MHRGSPAEPPARCDSCKRLMTTDLEGICTLCLNCNRYLCMTCKDPHAEACRPPERGVWASRVEQSPSPPPPPPPRVRPAKKIKLEKEGQVQADEETGPSSWQMLPMPAIVKICVWLAHVDSIFRAMSLSLVCKRWRRPLRGPALANALSRTDALVYGWFLAKQEWIPNLASSRNFHASIMADAGADLAEALYSGTPPIAIRFAEFRYNNPRVMIPFGDSHCKIIRCIHQDWRASRKKEERGINMAFARVKPMTAHVEHNIIKGVLLADKDIPVTHLMVFITDRDWKNFMYDSYDERLEIYNAFNAGIEQSCGKNVIWNIILCAGEDHEHEMSREDWKDMRGEFERGLSV